jgi:carbon storage regulator CsrA
MSVLAHTHEEWLCVGNNIYLRLLEVKENQVRIGIKAPLEKVYRDEVFLRIKSTEHRILATIAKRNDDLELE